MCENMCSLLLCERRSPSFSMWLHDWYLYHCISVWILGTGRYSSLFPIEIEYFKIHKLHCRCLTCQFGPYSLHPPQHPVVGASFEQLAARLSEVLLIVGLGKLLRSSDWASGEAGRTEGQKSRWILKTTPSRWQRTSTSHWCGLTHLLSCMHALANPQREMRMLCKNPSSRNAHKRHRLATAQTGYLRCVLRLLFTWPWPVQPGVGHFSTFSCMARTEQKNHRFRRKKKTQSKQLHALKLSSDRSFKPDWVFPQICYFTLSKNF